MERWYAPTSPFTRKVRIAAHELGLADRIHLVEVDPWTDARLRALNPLAKVPTLVLESGEVLYESGLLDSWPVPLSVSRVWCRQGLQRPEAVLARWPTPRRSSSPMSTWWTRYGAWNWMESSSKEVETR